MVQLPIVCPKCGSWNLAPLGNRRVALFGAIACRCEDCLWQGRILLKRDVLMLFVVTVATAAILILPMFITESLHP